MLMEAAKGGHFETMSLLLDWPTSSAASHTATASELASRTSKVLVYTLSSTWWFWSLQDVVVRRL